MPLHPIAVVNQVLEEYRSYLLTEFRARDPQLRQALENALDRPRFLTQEPFFQAHRPFKSGQPWSALGLDPTLAAVMEQRSGSTTAYLHQSDAITHLLGPSAGPMAVTSGTGSGKTECFMLPVIDNAIRDAAQFPKSGLTALLVYPMNALANDQEERIRQYLEATGHTAISVERYDRTTTETKRQQMRKNPPHILLTNYMMLEYLLVRPADRDHLFANHRCHFLVLDESKTQQRQDQLRHRPVLSGTFDPATRQFSTDPNQYPVSCILAPARTRCMVCGATAGSRSVISPVALGASAAVRVVAEDLVEGLAEQHRGQDRTDLKERLLIFADSRQDAAHQARFITYAGRYDRMRRRLLQALNAAPGRILNLGEAVQKLMALGVENRDNPHIVSLLDIQI